MSGFSDLTLTLKLNIISEWIPDLSKLEYWKTNQQFALLFSVLHPFRQQSDKVLTCFRKLLNKGNSNVCCQLLPETNTLLSSLLLGRVEVSFSLTKPWPRSTGEERFHSIHLLQTPSKASFFLSSLLCCLIEACKMWMCLGQINTT